MEPKAPKGLAETVVTDPTARTAARNTVLLEEPAAPVAPEPVATAERVATAATAMHPTVLAATEARVALAAWARAATAATAGMAAPSTVEVDPAVYPSKGPQATLELAEPAARERLRARTVRLEEAAVLHPAILATPGTSVVFVHSSIERVLNPERRARPQERIARLSEN